MKWTGLNELREKFLQFFESKGHLRLESFPLIPQNDKSLLLINSGMAPMKKYFTGEITPPSKRVTTCQKCIRTPDIERVGKTARHGTYFEMMGNFSFGDYFKKEASLWAWEFCLDVLEMPVNKLWVTIYLDDDEAFDIWVNDVGVDKDRIVRMGKEDNFWEHGKGPCGPCSEIYFDRGPEKGCGSPDCKLGCDCDRYVEFWNLVFTQFDNDGNGNYTRLAHPNIDTGMGLERLACIMQDVDNLFEVDTIQSIIKHVSKFADIEYNQDEKSDISLRVITDHIRSSTFMVGDGVMPSNEGRGYVLRRLLRRASRHGKLLGIEKPFLADICDTVIQENINSYPNLNEKKDFIKKVISVEEDSFRNTIDIGMQMLNSILDKGETSVLSGENAFKLYDTFGFPIDLTKEILLERSMSVNEDEFNSLMKAQRERARNARKDAGADAWKGSDDLLSDIKETEFVGYDSYEISDAKVIAIIFNGELVEALPEGEEGIVALDKTPFYAESGGQAGDTGEIFDKNSLFETLDTTKTVTGVVMHYGKSSRGAIIKDSIVTASINAEKRDATRRNHTAAHLVQSALRNVLGKHVEQAGQFVNDKEMRFDFSHFAAMTKEEIIKVEAEVNREILSAIPVSVKVMPIGEAKKLGAMALFGEKYGDEVRVVQIGEYSTELCAGSHAANTGNLGMFKIVSEYSVASGVRRIEALTGMNTVEYFNRLTEDIRQAAKFFKLRNAHELLAKAPAFVSELKEKDKEIESLRSKISSITFKSLISSAKETDGVKILSAKIEDATPDSLRIMGDNAKSSDENIVAVLAGINDKGAITFSAVCGKEAVKKGAHAGNIIREVAKITGGSGGGRPDSAMAGGKDISKLEEALKSVESIAVKMINKR